MYDFHWSNAKYINPSRATIPLIRPPQCDSEGGRIRGVLLYSTFYDDKCVLIEFVMTRTVATCQGSYILTSGRIFFFEVRIYLGMIFEYLILWVGSRVMVEVLRSVTLTITTNITTLTQLP